MKQSEESEQNEESSEESESGEMFETATDMALKRRMVSYKDVCLGVNGGEYSESSDSDYEPSSEEEESEGESEDSETENVLCPVVKLSCKERLEAFRPWKKTFIVKLLGKRVGLKFLHLRLLKLWHPVGKMDVIDLENDYFLDSCPNNPEKSQEKKQEDAVSENSPTPGTTPAGDGGSHNQENSEDALGHGYLMQMVTKESEEGNHEVIMVPAEEDRVPQTAQIAEVRIDPKKTENVVTPKVDGPKSFRSTKSLARGKGPESVAEGPKSSVLPKNSGGLISKGGPEVCAQGNKENVEPPPTLILKPNYKKIPSILGNVV
ncbi:hypothetical protein SESBI_42330 [Sesbania bispinosa]|nr:hypothetical protein SESBI_42330 [Sesbania bispinosa]